MPLDEYFMARALKLAELGCYTTDPNPRVGCVIVKDQQIIAEGWHQRAGQPHAEANALAMTPDVTGATAYVTLEPCSHFGKTPPCCDALINAGIKRVVAAMQDPNPLVQGQGLARLAAAGIEVVTGVLASEAQRLNRGFINRMTKNRPFVTSKLAMSLDGRTASAAGDSQWITSAQARADVQHLRAASSAILTGINTLLADNPRLTARVNVPVQQPLRVILDSQLRTPINAQIVQQPGRTLVLTHVAESEKIQALTDKGFEIHQLPLSGQHLELSAVMSFLATQACNNVLIEAGPILNGALLANNLIDELIIYLAPCLLGDGGRGLFHLPNLLTMADKKNLRLIDTRQVGPDLRLTFSPE
ncbi:bifunctional diaminohydroxyphosphoribosylaminopyrimidine deaminase/5-amino-6-(5-phosphoribosylamino)uracil reductase RibD [Methylocucumis oryzae]|uniref:Riboflavin biosynthesis protein RibD n=1 Tax=Methylocucumis oryzae TaxID=1632867 RepID=A0A0F3IMV3_9GAMM|nr:bifunctional diaminohydroxyphosphoribosylaminopyrimidine deaminase/5-amino-6-(5-phosphoribosylamino)uracil reductase RibD [Methylocucumis oryzae]KJV06874.1 riboflavin biosynthesis protein RibD [Methylocucumis oryzae]